MKLPLVIPLFLVLIITAGLTACTPQTPLPTVELPPAASPEDVTEPTIETPSTTHTSEPITEPVVQDEILDSSDSFLSSIPEAYKCDTSEDCIVYQRDCLTGSCWNKENLQKNSPPPNAGACLPPTSVSSCVCEKRRCQPVPTERNGQTVHVQSCSTNENCSVDEVCLDSNTISARGQRYAVKRYDAPANVCYAVCEFDQDCAGEMKCRATKLVSKQTWEALQVSSDWSNNAALQEAKIVRHCVFSDEE